MKTSKLKPRVAVLVILVFLSGYAYVSRPVAHTSKKFTLKFETEVNMSYAEAFVVLEKSGVLIDDELPLQLDFPIVIGKCYFFPVVCPMGGMLLERGYYVDPSTETAYYIDNSSKHYWCR